MGAAARRKRHAPIRASGVVLGVLPDSGTVREGEDMMKSICIIHDGEFPVPRTEPTIGKFANDQYLVQFIAIRQGNNKVDVRYWDMILIEKSLWDTLDDRWQAAISINSRKLVFL
jgi:hypothetical protein